MYCIGWNRLCWRSFTLRKLFAAQKSEKIVICDFAVPNISQYRGNIVSWLKNCDSILCSLWRFPPLMFYYHQLPPYSCSQTHFFMKLFKEFCICINIYTYTNELDLHDHNLALCSPLIPVYLTSVGKNKERRQITKKMKFRIDKKEENKWSEMNKTKI